MAEIMTLVEPRFEDSGLNRTVELLGGRRILHRSVQSRLDAHDLLQEGLPGKALSHLVGAVLFLNGDHGGLEKAVGISIRTYYRKRNAAAAEKPLSREQSGRVWKFAEILSRATAIFGSQGEAEAWLDRPALALDQRKPIDLLSTPAGVESVEDHLTRVEYGVYT